jgi:competence protein ComEC
VTQQRRIDARLAVPATAAWIAAAALQAQPVGTGVVATIAGVATAVAVVVLSSCQDAHARIGRPRPDELRMAVVAAALGCAAGAAAMSMHLAALHRGPVAALARDDASVEMRLKLVRDPMQVTARTGRPLSVVDATATAVRRGDGSWQSDHAPVTVFAVAGHWLGLLPGQHVTVEARLRPPRRGDLVAAVAFAADTPRLVGRPSAVQRWAGRIRSSLRDACAGLSGDQRGLVPGLVLGDVAAMPPDLTVAFRMTGLTHLNAVSGANVAIVLGAVLAMAQRAGVGRRWRALLAAAALPAFVVLVRPSPSVLRAALMGGLVMTAVMLGRRASSVPILSATVLALVVVDPFLARSPGFAMSVAATAAIVLLAPPWTRRLARRMPWPVAVAIAVPAAAQLACTPVLVAAFGQLTPLAVPANMLAAPAVAPATLAGIACALLATISTSAAVPLAHVAGLSAGWLAIVARTFAAIPGAGLRGPTGLTGVLLVGTIAVACWLFARLVRRWVRRAMLGAWRP